MVEFNVSDPNPTSHSANVLIIAKKEEKFSKSVEKVVAFKQE